MKNKNLGLESDNQINPKVYYLIGALRDGCLTTQWTIKFKQKNREWLSDVLVPLFRDIFNRIIENNIYRDSEKTVWYLAFKDKEIWNKLNTFMRSAPRTKEEEKFYIKGFWDADGGCPKNPTLKKKIYIKFTQKDEESLMQLKHMIENIVIKCGDVGISEYGKNGIIWKISITNKIGICNFCNKIGSFHPEKKNRLIKIQYLLSTR